ncbi:MAG: UDP-N-acetylglucosamine 2-epimerase (non-hydrolyzing) [Anaerolineales bacterium]|jgi:UDP-N-acetylglucosamine 2-epimerase (non-hydrolysing)
MPDRPLKVLSIFGTRPEAVKMAPVVKALSNQDGVTSRVCVTAQHREMLDQVLNLFDIVPDLDLDLMRPGQTLAELTAAVFSGLDPVLRDEAPDWVLVQGDTTTVMAASLLAFYHHVRVGHVEAGLRTGDKWHPFPEEINRRIAGVTADLHFAPTAKAKENLLREGVPPSSVVVTGNPVIDALRMIVDRPYDLDSGPLAALPADRRWVVVTAHRRESLGRPMELIFTMLRELAEEFQDDIHLIYPVHLNPRVQEPAHRILGGLPNLRLVDPLDYQPMLQLMRRAALIMTDSGGIQEEGTALGVPVLVMRDTTERPEAIEAGNARLVGTEPDAILNAARRVLSDPDVHAEMSHSSDLFGDGNAAERIVAGLMSAASASPGSS